MKVILALGNPGEKYAYTRHNTGFLVIDQLAAEQSAQFSNKPKFSANIAELNMSGEKILLVKPTTYYNDIGISARAILDFYKLVLDDLLIIHDDTALDFGKIRVRKGGESAGNNGLKSLHQHIGKNFWHIRIGTDNLLRRQIGDVDFVLSKFNADEQKILRGWTVPESVKLIEKFLDGTIEPFSIKL
ncbi:MAG: aminoacyl-tRNA hydrolase [Candidatus Nanogingivalaceae bacterium]|jgi:aminoacyl-tRNA hydrolase|nr:aminoacyl-tRNA hydrolase [Candidatus Nanogingivalaceae bacterium]